MDPIDAIKKWLQDAGYNLKSRGVCQHTCGMPMTPGVLVMPNWSPVDGEHILKVTATSVFQLTVRIPYNYNDWSIYGSYPYTSQDQLKKILDGLVNAPAGCWKS